MNEEEKEAIKTLADLKERKFYTHAFDNGTLVLDDDEIESIDMILNLIEKQEKLIQGLNKQADELVDDYEKQLQEKNEYIFRLESERDRWE